MPTHNPPLRIRALVQKNTVLMPHREWICFLTQARIYKLSIRKLSSRSASPNSSAGAAVTTSERFSSPTTGLGKLQHFCSVYTYHPCVAVRWHLQSSTLRSKTITEPPPPCPTAALSHSTASKPGRRLKILGYSRMLPRWSPAKNGIERWSEQTKCRPFLLHSSQNK